MPRGRKILQPERLSPPPSCESIETLIDAAVRGLVRDAVTRTANGALKAISQDDYGVHGDFGSEDAWRSSKSRPTPLDDANREHRPTRGRHRDPNFDLLATAIKRLKDERRLKAYRAWRYTADRMLALAALARAPHPERADDQMPVEPNMSAGVDLMITACRISEDVVQPGFTDDQRLKTVRDKLIEKLRDLDRAQREAKIISSPI
jgi:hypothetical protein